MGVVGVRLDCLGYVRVRKVCVGGSSECVRGERRVGKSRRGWEVGVGVRVERRELGLGLKLVKKLVCGVLKWGLEV